MEITGTCTHIGIRRGTIAPRVRANNRRNGRNGRRRNGSALVPLFWMSILALFIVARIQLGRSFAIRAQATQLVTSDEGRFERTQAILRARPDLFEPLRAALRADLGTDLQGRLHALAHEESNLAALQLVIVGGYYTDKRVRELIGYPGQLAIDVKSWLVPQYLEEGLIDAVLARGAVWRDPQTGVRAVIQDHPTTYAERFTDTAPGPDSEGGNDGRDS